MGAYFPILLRTTPCGEAVLTRVPERLALDFNFDIREAQVRAIRLDAGSGQWLPAGPPEPAETPARLSTMPLPLRLEGDVVIGELYALIELDFVPSSDGRVSLSGHLASVFFEATQQRSRGKASEAKRELVKFCCAIASAAAAELFFVSADDGVWREVPARDVLDAIARARISLLETRPLVIGAQKALTEVRASLECENYAVFDFIPT
jgi:hypothetical protein